MGVLLLSDAVDALIDRSVLGLMAAIGLSGCGDDAVRSPDAGNAPACMVEQPSIIMPIWLAGEAGARSELGKLGKPDAIFITGDGILARI
ncbi:MAG: hypothetical protein GY811_25935 [Myxococcales bacterium]|nr:hypothetical protein [Myxococcales bacterium]